MGVIHAWQLTPSGIEGRIAWWAAPQFALSYTAGVVFLLACAWWARWKGLETVRDAVESDEG